MATDSENTVQIGDANAPIVISNTVALIGVILACLSVILLVVLFVVAGQLPDDINEFQRRLSADTPSQLRLLILSCSIAVLTLVAFVLCLVGLFLPRRPRLLAGIGVGISFLILAGVFGVLLVGAMINPEGASEPVADEVVAPASESPQ